MIESTVPPPRTPTKAKRTTAPALPDLLTLSTIEIDYQLSTKWAEVYTARSDRHETTLYRVTYYPRESRWSCDCPAAAHPSCKHRVRCAVLREARFFERLLADCTPGELRAMVPGKQAQVSADVDALSAHAALLVIDCLLLAADEPALAAA